MLDQLFIDQPLEVGPIQVWPIAGRIGHLRYQVPAASGELNVRELADPEVGRIEIHNAGRLPLVIPAGWLIEGLRQSRMVVDDVLIPAGVALAVPVACVEAGRWGEAHQSRSAGRAPARVMVAAQSKPRTTVTDPSQQDDRQRRVWTAVHAYETRTGRRPTSSLPTILGEDVRRTRTMVALTREIDALDFPNGADGYVVALGPRPVLIEIWSRPEPVAYMLRSLLRGLLLDLPDLELGPPIRRGVVDLFIDQARAAVRSDLGDSGAGRLMALDHPRLQGTALLAETGEFLHLTAMSRDLFDLAV